MSASIDVGNVLAGQYRIERLLGSGGFGRTYLAQDTVLGDKVVIKELLEKWVKNKKVRQRFISEPQAMRRLNHPNVVTIYNLLTPESHPKINSLYIVMEYISGGSLESRMRSGLTWEEIIKISIEVCQGLGAAHDQGIVHRDIKPANILLKTDLSAVKLCDFGIAHIPDRQLTSGEMHPGTLLYMAPESFNRVAGQDIDGRADLYALGVTLYQLLTGQDYLSFDECVEKAEREIRLKFRVQPDIDLTFDQQIQVQILTQQYWMNAVCNETTVDPREHNSAIPPDLAKVVITALTKEPANRYASSESMISDLRKVRLGNTPQPGTQVISASGGQVNDVIARSLDAARQQQLTTAFELAQQAVGLAPTNTRAFANLANILMLRGDFSGAVETWLKILDIDINYPELYSKIGQCYNRMGQIDKAIEIQTRGLRLPENRNNASLYHGLANSYRLANRPDEAIWALEQSLKIRPDPRLKILLQRWNAERRS